MQSVNLISALETNYPSTVYYHASGIFMRKELLTLSVPYMFHVQKNRKSPRQRKIRQALYIMYGKPMNASCLAGYIKR